MATSQGKPDREQKPYIGTITNIGNSQGLYIELDKIHESGLEIGDQVLVDTTNRDAAGLEILKHDDVLDY